MLILVRSQDIYESLLKGENKVYLAGQKLPSNIVPVKSWADLRKQVLGSVELMISGLPTHAIRNFNNEHGEEMKKYFEENIPLVCLSKGIDAENLLLPDDIYFEKFPEFTDLFCFLSGPSFAKEIVEKQVTCVSLASKSRQTLLSVTEMLSTPYFKVFPTYDVKGVLLGGALKNVLAIAGGIVEGLGFNHNTRAAMITRGIEEMLRFGKIFNASPETFYGYSGMGDLILTTTGDLSRNKNFGIEIAKGRSPQEIIGSQRQVVEGYKTALAAFKMAQKYDLKVRLFEAVYRVLYENLSPKKALEEMMATPVKFDT